MDYYGRISLSDEKTEITETTNQVKEKTNQLYESIQITQCYANTIIAMEQYNHPELKNLPTIYKNLTYQSQSWNSEIKPKLGNCISKLRSFYAKYRTAYDTLKEINGDGDYDILKNKSNLVSALKTVQKSIKSVKTEIAVVTPLLKDFSDSILNNKQALTDVVQESKKLIEKNDSALAELREESQKIENEINDLQKKLITSSVFTGLGALAIIIGPILIATGVGAPLGMAVLAGGIITTSVAGDALGKANSQLIEAKNRRKKICDSIAEKNKDSVILTNINTNFSTIITQGNQATIVANNLFNGFEQIYDLISKVQANAQNMALVINEDDPDTFELVVELRTLNTSFDALKNITEKYEKNFILPVQNQSQFTQSSVLSILDPTQPLLDGDFAYNFALANNPYLKNTVSVK